MKKTLTLLALLGAVATTPLSAKEVWMKGVVCSDNTNPYSSSSYPKKVEAGAYTFSKDDAGPSAGEQCWAVAAADTLAWWQDRVEQNGALIIQPETPRGVELWKTISSMFGDDGYPRYAMDYWLFGKLPDYAMKMSKPDIFWEPDHPGFNGYYSHLKGRMDEQNAEDYMMTTSIAMYYTVKLPDYPDEVEAARAVIQGRERDLVQLVEDGWGICFHTDIHAMAAYGFEVNEEGLPTMMYYTDNNEYYVRTDLLEYTNMREDLVKGTNITTMNLITATGYDQIRQFTGIRTTGIQFDTYELTFDGDGDEPLFSHYLNVTYDGGEHTLQYDLRNAKDEGSPVTAKDKDGKLISTGDITLKKGTLSLVEGVGEYDGGGKTSGSITFKDEGGANRTLSVQHTDTIAKEIIIAASGGNTLEVTEGNTASFGKLSGTGNLDKTGIGTAEVTGTLTLQGEIRVHDGSFIIGNGAVTSGGTSFTVDGGVLKGSGSFAGGTVNGGTLIVGNSPGRQSYTGDLSVNLGEIIFGVSGWDAAADEDNVGWESGTYSNVVMNGNSLTLGGDSKIRFGVGNDALTALLDSDSGTAFSMTIATGIGNKDYFTSDLLKQLAAQTIFYVTDELGAVITNDAGLNAGDSLNTRITDLKYNLVDNTALCVTGVYWAAEPAVPEPTTGTLSLLALAGLCARRRRK